MRWLLISVFVLASSCGGVLCSAEDEFTAWMKEPEFNAFLERLGIPKPGDTNSKNVKKSTFWERGYWLDAVQARLHDGRNEYRLKFGYAPKNRAFWWFWFWGQTEQDVRKHGDEFLPQGYTLVSLNRYQLPDGSIRYCDVWHKIAK